MAGKLKDDHIRIILDVEATGVQAELQKITSSSVGLANANKTMAAEMKAAENQMKESLKEMKLLEKQGLQTSKAYQNYENTLESAREEVAAYTRKIAENEKAMAANEKQHAEIIKTMKIEDMTMSQLKQRAADLQMQMNNTAVSLSPEAYKKLGKELEQVNSRMSVVENTNKSMLQEFAGMHNPVGSAARAVQGFVQVLNYVAKHPIVAVILLIVGLLMKLKDAFSKNEEAVNSLNRIMAPFKNMLDMIIDAIMGVVNWLLKFAETALNAMYKLAEYLPFIGEKMKEVNEESRKAIELEIQKQKLQEQQRENIVKISKNEKEIARLRDEAAQKDKYNITERIARLEQAKKLDLEIVDIKRKEQQSEIDILEKATDIVKKTTDWKNKIAEARVELEKVDTKYYTKERELDRQINAEKISARNKAISEANKAREEQLKEIDKSLKLEINQLKQARLEGIKTEKEYNDEVEKLTLAALEKKKAIKGQEKSALIEYDAQILDAQLKQQTEADRILLEALTKEHQKELSMLDSQRNYRLEKLQEEESDQKIYALRAAEIEAETAKAREDVIRAFGQTLEQTEFNNNQTRLEAIEKNGEEIIKADSETLKRQADLRKLFARTTADFERQYNIKTWEQRKEDEIQILKKQHAENLISEETYQLALKAIEKKYEDEKLKVRQQYGLAGMAETYQLELDALQEQLDKKLISEEDFERAKLAIKLKYAAELSQKAGEFANAGANAVKSIEEAATAKLDAEYTKRQSALTEQYNAGIISKEEYNAQKEELDYEQKSKELEIEKKFADANFAMQAAQIVASTAQGIITAWSTSMQLGPVAGPIAAAAMTALLGITSIAQLAKAKAERDRVKAMTMESPGGGSSAPKTGEIRLKQGFAEGGLNDDLTSGGYTGAGSKYDVAGYIPVHSGEYVIAQDELQQPEIMNMARAIENVRRQRTNRNPAPAGFADGGSNTPGGSASAMAMIDNKTVSRLVSILDRLQNSDIVVQTNYGITELEAEQRKKQEAESKFTRKS